MSVIPSQEWIDVHLPEGRTGVMKFTLVWTGQLPSSGNKSKLEDVTRMRSELSPQLSYLWDTHPALQVPKEQGFLKNPANTDQYLDLSKTPRELAQRHPGYMIDLCDWLPVGSHRY